MSGQEDADNVQRKYRAPYTGHRPIPTVAKYREEKEARKAEAGREGSNDANGADLAPSKTERAKDGWRNYWYGGKDGDDEKESDGRVSGPDKQENDGTQPNEVDVDEDGDIDEDDAQAAEVTKDTSEIVPSANPKERRKHLGKEERAEREVTDPITHLPARIYDFTQDSLQEIDENPLPFGQTAKTATGLSNKNKSASQLHSEFEEIQQGKDSLSVLFPPPSFDAVRQDLVAINRQGTTVGLTGTAIVLILVIGLERIVRPGIARLVGHQDDHGLLIGMGVWLGFSLLSAGGIWYWIRGVRNWMANRISDSWEDQVWEANLQSRERQAKEHKNESVAWLNSLLAAIWPLINPDLFTSLADTLEDVMQASLPKLVRMVAVEDLGQGSESLRILGIRWLPTGAAARSVSDEGKLASKKQSKKQNDRAVPGEGKVDDTAEDGDDAKDDEEGDKGKSDDGTEKTQVAEGMEAEEGDFINMEVAFAYRARASKSFAQRTKDIHLYLAFYLPGNIKIPVWVDFKGIVGVARLRLQLTPDPPFFALCTITFMGQPKVDIGCVPIVKHGLNLMDLPLISNFVQSSVDAAVASYVAPKSLTLDLKDMLAGDDFKKDTIAKGVIVVDIKRGYDFKMGDASIPLISDGSSDPYVSVGWAKFGKPLFSTRVLVSEMEPYWHERAVILVTPEELNVDERLRLQLWDSDRFTADDDLGRIEVDLKQIMKSEESNGRMHDRTDGFRALKAGENMPGKLEWSVGYFSKTRLQSCQFEKQTYDPSIRNMKDLEQLVQKDCESKLRESMIKKGRHSRDADELEQQRAQEMKMKEDAIVISSPPPDQYPSGIFSIQIHQITGLELESLSKSDVDKKKYQDDEEEDGEELPSAYCNIIINHKKVFKTRTKPKNARPFFNAGTERFIADWRSTEVFISVRDARVDEDDPILGIVHLLLSDIFKERAQVNGYYPLTGGIGHGRIRVSMVWRSIQLQAPRELLGWDFGTIEIKPTVSSADVPRDLQALKLKLHTNIGSGKLYAHRDEVTWRARNDRSLYLAVEKRYASCLAIRFKKTGMIKDQTAAFAVLWLKDIADQAETELTLPVYTGDYERARNCCLDSPGERIGSIKITLAFWAGLGAAHSRWASKDPDMRNIMEVLDVAQDEHESRETEKAAGIVDADDSSSSSSDSNSDEEEAERGSAGSARKGEKDVHGKAHDTVENDDDHDDAKTTLVDKARDYKKYAKQQHRRNRGVMQYKFPRTLNWAANKGERLGHKVESMFTRHTRQPGIETEV